jgi:hypothetical protein
MSFGILGAGRLGLSIFISTVFAIGWIPTRSSLVAFLSSPSWDSATQGAGGTREVKRGYRSVDRAYQAPSSVVLRKVVTPPTGFRKKGLGGWRIKTRGGGSLKIEGSSKDGRKTSNALMADEARFLVHNADSM